MGELGAATPAKSAERAEQGNAAVAERAGEATEQARDKAQEMMQQGRGRARQEIDQRSTQVGEQIQSTGADLRTVGEELRKQGKDTPAKVADNAAQRTERLGDYLKEADSDRILRDVEDFGRRQPMAVLAGGLLAGFALARFLKASSSRRYNQYRLESPGSPVPSSPANGSHSTRFEPHS